MNTLYNGVYADDIREFIELKRRCGFKYVGESIILSYFDRFATERGWAGIGISRKLAQEWSKKRDNESEAYRYKRTCVLNQFALYLNKKGMPSAIIQVPPPKKSYTPYIYTQEEIDKILFECDKMTCVPVASDSTRFVMPALLRFLFATGVRVGEAIEILDDDMNLENKMFALRDTKNGRERLVPFTDSLREVLVQYKSHRNRLISKPKAPQFFLTFRGHKCNVSAVYTIMRDLIGRAKIPFMGHGRGPHVHHIRHTFAVRSLVKMVRDGMDIYCSLPILSTYLGHQSVEATNNYVRLTKEIYPELMSDIDQNLLVNVFPCLKNDETDEND